jgi:hypothetical protein
LETGGGGVGGTDAETGGAEGRGGGGLRWDGGASQRCVEDDCMPGRGVPNLPYVFIALCTSMLIIRRTGLILSIFKEKGPGMWLSNFCLRYSRPFDRRP